MADSCPLITLTTDFGWRDSYVAQMKGVILSIDPNGRITDLSHDIARHDITEGALFLAGALPFFPPGTINVAVVDPGVGSSRNPIVASLGDQYLVCPDNGLLTLVARELKIKAIHIIENKDYMRGEISATFHGRDIFAPAAAHLANGVPLESFGPKSDDYVTLDIGEPSSSSKNHVDGVVIHVDRFGNSITNIRPRNLQNREAGTIRCGPCEMEGIKRTYADVPRGKEVALYGSSGFLEIAVNTGNAADIFGLRPGTRVQVNLT